MFHVKIIKPAGMKDLWQAVCSTPEPRKYLCGGTDLCINARHERGVPCNWIDVSDIPELLELKDCGDHIFIGAAVKLSDICASPLVAKWLPVLSRAACQFASPPLRNMASLGGNCANASPSADGACALCAEGATAVINLYGEERKIPVESLFKGPKKTSLSPDELITGFTVPKTRHEGAYIKMAARNAFAITKISAAVSLRREKDKVEHIRIFLGAVGPTPVRAIRTEDLLRGARLDAAFIDKAKKTVMREVSPIDDQRSTAEYRTEMSGVLTARCLESFAADTH